MATPNDPITREEQYLASMAGQEVDLPQPITRVEKYLAKASGMDVETPDPITREEKYLDAIAEGGGGGSSVTVEPLTVTQNGTQTAPSGKAYSPVTVNVPNPNYVETIEGTLANPWGGYAFSEIRRSIANNIITAYITTSESHRWYVPTGRNAGNNLWVRFNAVQAGIIDYNALSVLSTGATSSVHYEYRDGNYTETSIDPTTPCTLTIIHHPLPSNG